MTEAGGNRDVARWKIGYGLCLFGLTLSTYLLLTEWLGRRAFCFGSQACANLFYRPESDVWGVPVALLGALYFAFRGIAYGLGHTEIVRRTSSVGMVVALLLSAQLYLRVGYMCWPCTTVHLVAVLEFALLHGFQREAERRGGSMVRLLPTCIALAASALALGVSPRIKSYEDRVEMPAMGGPNAATLILGEGGEQYTVYCRADCVGCEDLLKRARRALTRRATPVETALGQQRPKFKLVIRYLTLKEPTDEDARKIAGVLGTPNADLEAIKSAVRWHRRQPLDVTPTFFDKNGDLVANGRFFARHAVD